MTNYIDTVMKTGLLSPLNSTSIPPNTTISSSPVATSHDSNDALLAWNIFQTTSSLLLAILGIIGNLLIVATIVHNKKMQNLQNYFVLSLAITDIVTFTVILPLSLISKYMTWPFGEVTCKYVLPISDAVTAVSILTLVAISIDRYCAVSTSLRKSPSLLCGKFIIVGIWAFSYLTVGVPLVFTFEVRQFGDRLSCIPIWKSVSIQLTYFITRTLLFYIIPSLSIYLCYVLVNNRLSQNLKFLQRSVSGIGKMRRLRQHKKVIKMFFAIFLSFVICFLPLNIIALLLFIQPVAEYKYITQIYELTILFAICNSAGNPVILYVLSRAYCESFRKYLPILKKIRFSRIKWITRHDDADLDDLADAENLNEDSEYCAQTKDESLAFVTKNRGFTITTSISSSLRHAKNSTESQIVNTNHRNLLDVQENISSRSSQDLINNQKST